MMHINCYSTRKKLKRKRHWTTAFIKAKVYIFIITACMCNDASFIIYMHDYTLQSLPLGDSTRRLGLHVEQRVDVCTLVHFKAVVTVMLKQMCRIQSRTNIQCPMHLWMSLKEGERVKGWTNWFTGQVNSRFWMIVIFRRRTWCPEAQLFQGLLTRLWPD